MAGWLHGVCVGECVFVFPLCGFSLSLFCNYLSRTFHPLDRNLSTPETSTLCTLYHHCSVAGVVCVVLRHAPPAHWVAFTESAVTLALLDLCSPGRVHSHGCVPGCCTSSRPHSGRPTAWYTRHASSYKRVKGRSHTVEKRKAIHPQKPHATSQPSRFSHTPRLSTDSAHN